MARALTEAVILAAGEGTRLRPLTFTRPKVLIPLANTPFLGHQIRLLEECGIERVVLVAGYMLESIEAWLAESDHSADVEIVVQAEARGTGDAIGKARNSVSGPFLVMNGDVLVDRGSLEAMIAGGRVSVSARKVGNPQDYGVFELKDGFVKRVVEKADQPPSNLANVGVYLFEPEIFERIDATPPNPVRHEVEITDTLQAMADSGVALACQEVAEWYELGKPWDIISLNEMLVPRLPAVASPEAVIDGSVDPGVTIGADTVVEEGAHVRGPSIIGSGCRVGGGCEIGPYTSLGDHVALKASVIDGSVLMRGCTVGEGSSISCSVLGEGVMVGDRVNLVASSGDASTVRLRIKGRTYDSGRARMGPIVGDRCRVETGAVLGPGAMINPKTTVPGP